MFSYIANKSENVEKWYQISFKNIYEGIEYQSCILYHEVFICCLTIGRSFKIFVNFDHGVTGLLLQ